MEALAEGDIFKFLEGTWSVAVDGEAWDKKYMNVYAPRISPDGSRVAVEIRTDIADYTLAENETPWENKFGCIWEPLYRPDGSLVVPVRLPPDGPWRRMAMSCGRDVTSSSGTRK